MIKNFKIINKTLCNIIFFLQLVLFNFSSLVVFFAAFLFLVFLVPWHGSVFHDVLCSKYVSLIMRSYLMMRMKILIRILILLFIYYRCVFLLLLDLCLLYFLCFLDLEGDLDNFLFEKVIFIEIKSILF